MSIGYGFGDEHVNEILSQALRRESTTRLFVVSNCEDEECANPRSDQIRRLLEVQTEQIKVHRGKTKQFLESKDLKDLLTQQIVPGDSAF